MPYILNKLIVQKTAFLKMSIRELLVSKATICSIGNRNRIWVCYTNVESETCVLYRFVVYIICVSCEITVVFSVAPHNSIYPFLARPHGAGGVLIYIYIHCIRV